MAVPYRKTADISSLGDNEIVELWNLVCARAGALRAATKAQGFNIGLNLGECAGAGIVDYLHVHIVPRWSGDTNFMPILSGTRMLSEGLRGLYDKLIEAQTKIDVRIEPEHMNGWADAPPPKRGLGCFARGCLILVVFAIVLGYRLCRRSVLGFSAALGNSRTAFIGWPRPTRLRKRLRRFLNSRLRTSRFRRCKRAVAGF